MPTPSPSSGPSPSSNPSPTPTPSPSISPGIWRPVVISVYTDEVPKTTITSENDGNIEDTTLDLDIGEPIKIVSFNNDNIINVINVSIDNTIQTIVCNMENPILEVNDSINTINTTTNNTIINTTNDDYITIILQ